MGHSGWAIGSKASRDATPLSHGVRPGFTLGIASVMIQSENLYNKPAREANAPQAIAAIARSMLLRRRVTICASSASVEMKGGASNT